MYKEKLVSFLVVQWLGLRAFTAVGWDSIPGRGTKIPQAAQNGQNKQTKKKPLKKNNIKQNKQFRTGKSYSSIFSQL